MKRDRSTQSRDAVGCFSIPRAPRLRPARTSRRAAVSTTGAGREGARPTERRRARTLVLAGHGAPSQGTLWMDELDRECEAKMRAHPLNSAPGRAARITQHVLIHRECSCRHGDHYHERVDTAWNLEAGRAAGCRGAIRDREYYIQVLLYRILL
jgi:hypothetical protein